MNPTQELILDSLRDLPIGETDNFIWFITDIGILALFKKDEDYESCSLKVAIEAKNLALDITKEEKEYLEINNKRIFLFYS